MKHAWVILLIGLAACSVDEGPPDYTVYLVRHAEKLAEGDDPELSVPGYGRAAKLAGWMASHPVATVWSSNTRRTIQTAAPVQVALSIPLRRYDPADLPALAETLREVGANALVVGHSNTTPQLAALLCDCSVPEMDDSDYDQLLVIVVRKNQGELTVLSQAEAFSD